MSLSTAAEEEAVFDRQTRLWGAAAQKQIRNSKVLVRGNLLGLASELCKNLVLAGVNVTIQDDTKTNKSDVINNIFLRIQDEGKPRAEACLERLQEMNPFAKVELLSNDDKIENIATTFTLVVSIGEDFETIEKVGKACREVSVPFLAAKDAGLLAFALLDLGKEYSYIVEGNATSENVTKVVSFSPIENILHFNKWSLLPKKGRAVFPLTYYAIWLSFELENRKTQQNIQKKEQEIQKRGKIEDENIIEEILNEMEIGDQQEKIIALFHILKRGNSLPPVCTVFGGLIGQEVLKVVSGRGEPINNMMVFDGLDSSACVRLIPPK